MADETVRVALLCRGHSNGQLMTENMRMGVPMIRAFLVAPRQIVRAFSVA
jgi:hypothetical protein